MSHVLVTGAQGFIGQVLVRRLLAQGLDGQAIERMTLMDLNAGEPSRDQRVRHISGSIADAAVRAQVGPVPVDAIFHLASVPGGAAEKNYELGRSINLDATLALLEDFRNTARPPRFIYASTIAVYGEHLPQLVDETTLPAPALSYGAHKLACEALVADASRKGWVQGVLVAPARCSGPAGRRSRAEVRLHEPDFLEAGRWPADDCSRVP